MTAKIQNSPNRLAVDVKGTQDLREKFQKDPKGGLKAAAQQFEAMFLQTVLKSMRDATPQDGMFNSEQSRFYTSMLDQQLAQNMASSGKGVGFAKLIEQQLGRNLSSAGDGGGAQATERAVSAINGAAENAALPLAASNGRHLATLGKAVPAATLGEAAPVFSGEGATPTAKEFVNRVWPHAVEASRSTGIPPQFLVAHAALETGWGKSEIRKADGSPSYNLFGIKAGKSWTGATIEAKTTEYVDGQSQRVSDKFRAYSSYAESFRDYANLLRNNPRYGGVIGSQNGTEFARHMQQAGYATDPMYADKLARIINGPTLKQALIG